MLGSINVHCGFAGPRRSIEHDSRLGCRKGYDVTGNFDEFATASSQTIIAALGESALPNLLDASEAMTVQAHGAIVTYSRKVFIPLTKLSRDACHYCDRKSVE